MIASACKAGERTEQLVSQPQLHILKQGLSKDRISRTREHSLVFNTPHWCLLKHAIPQLPRIWGPARSLQLPSNEQAASHCVVATFACWSHATDASRFLTMHTSQDLKTARKTVLLLHISCYSKDDE